MRPRIETLDPMRLYEILSYDQETGVFKWKQSRPPRGVAGDVAGWMGRKYWLISIGAKTYYAHRIAWAMAHGKWPLDQIDHINHIKTDNSIANLREANSRQNGENKVKAQVNNKSCGLLGVSWDKRRGVWVSGIQANKKRIRIGDFSNPMDAHQAYLDKKRSLHSFNTL
jgi:hypothetical protein